MKLFWTKEQSWLDRWDAFIVNNDLGNHLLLSDWLASYNSYGFDFEICPAIVENEIVGGYGAVIARFSLFKFYIIPFGPILIKEQVVFISELIGFGFERSKQLNCCYFQINLPLTATHSLSNHLLQAKLPPDLLSKSFAGTKFKYVYSCSGLNWIPLKDYIEEDALLLSLPTNTRRNIRSSIRKNLELKFLKSEHDIQSAYVLFEENARRGNYAIRSWNDFKTPLINLTNKGAALVLGAFLGTEIKGAIVLMKSGNFYTFVMGGAKRETPDLHSGYFLQWCALKNSLNNNFDGYNISLGGSEGVEVFKKGFNPNKISFEDGRRYWIIKPTVFSAFLLFEKYIRPYKKQISILLMFFKRFSLNKNLFI